MPHTSAPAAAVPRPPTTALSLPIRVYLVRGIIALAWTAAFATVNDAIDAVSGTLLLIYPLIDVVGTLLDPGDGTDAPARTLQRCNAVLSTLAVVALAVAAAHGIPAVLHVFGAWAVVSGAAQLVVGLRRRRPKAGAQWPMLIAGGLSALVGIFYNIEATGDAPTLDGLVTYATAGGSFFVVQAALLAWRVRKNRAAGAV